MITKDIEQIDRIIERMDNALGRLHEVAQGRVYTVGTKVNYQGKFGVVIVLNQGSQDPTASTVDLRLEDGTVVNGVSVAAANLELFRQ